MPGQLFRRVLALAVVGLWLAPSAGAVALGLHLALDHHGGGDDDGGAPRHEPALLAELVAGVIHGHHHSAAAPHHEHPAHLDATPGLFPTSPSPVATAAEETRVVSGDGHGEAVASWHRRAPPVPLFHAHCSLLL